VWIGHRQVVRSGVALACLVALALACSGIHGPRIPPCPGSLRDTRQIEGDWVRHERVRVKGQEVDESFGLVVQKRGTRLLLVGLTPLGAKAFSVTQIEGEIRTRSYLGPALRVPPENVLRDLHRIRFLDVDDPVFEGRVLVRGADGSAHVANPSCGYEATFARVRADPSR